MNNLVSKVFKSSILSSIALIALGILLIVQSEATIITISYIIGAFLIALGVIAGFNFIRNFKDRTKGDLDIVYGIVCIILGVVVIKNPEAIASIIPFVLGLVIIINSATKLQYSFELHREKNNLWLSTLILSIIMVVCGIVLIFNPFAAEITPPRAEVSFSERVKTSAPKSSAFKRFNTLSFDAPPLNIILSVSGIPKFSYM